jgi:hypothetical protein
LTPITLHLFITLFYFENMKDLLFVLLLVVLVWASDDSIYTINSLKLKTAFTSNDAQPIVESASPFHKTITQGLDSISITKPLTLNDWMNYGVDSQGSKKIRDQYKDERNFVPTWVASTKVNASVSWKGPCFQVCSEFRSNAHEF